LGLPHSFRQAVEQYGSGRVNRDGVLPWQVGEHSLRLTEAFKDRNWNQVRLEAAVLAHYVADAHNPLHVTTNFDGQLTRQTGLADRFEIRVLDRYSKFFILHPEDAVKIDDPTEYAFQTCLEAYSGLDSIILADLRAREGLPDYTDEYFDRFYPEGDAPHARNPIPDVEPIRAHQGPRGYGPVSIPAGAESGCRRSSKGQIDQRAEWRTLGVVRRNGRSTQRQSGSRLPPDALHPSADGRQHGDRQLACHCAA